MSCRLVTAVAAVLLKPEAAAARASLLPSTLHEKAGEWACGTCSCASPLSPLWPNPPGKEGVWVWAGKDGGGDGGGGDGGSGSGTHE